MTTPINSSILRAKQFVPNFSGTQPDAEVAQALALIGVGEILTLILQELQTARLERQQSQRVASQQHTSTRRPTRSREMLDATQ